MEIYKVFPQDRVRRSGLRTRSLTFQLQVEVFKIVLKLFIVQGFPICVTRHIKGFLALFTGVKKCEDPAHPGVGTGCAVELMDAMSLPGLEHGGQGIDMGAALLWLLRGKSGPAWCVLLLVYPLTQWLELPLVQAVRGCRLSAVEASGRISSSTLPALPRCSHLKTGHFSIALVSFSLFWRVGVACGVQRIGIFGRSCVHLTWFDSGHMFFEALST